MTGTAPERVSVAMETTDGRVWYCGCIIWGVARGGACGSAPSVLWRVSGVGLRALIGRALDVWMGPLALIGRGLDA